MNRSRKVFAVILVLVLALFGIEPVLAQDKQMALTEERTRFKLFTNCKPVDLVVESLNQAARRIGLTETDIIAAAESRLRSARIYTADITGPYLYINVNVSSAAYAIIISLNKRLFDPISGTHNLAQTWYRASTGIHAGKSGFILSDIAEHMDQFIVQFLRANEKACEQK